MSRHTIDFLCMWMYMDTVLLYPVLFMETIPIKYSIWLRIKFSASLWSWIQLQAVLVSFSLSFLKKIWLCNRNTINTLNFVLEGYLLAELIYLNIMYFILTLLKCFLIGSSSNVGKMIKKIKSYPLLNMQDNLGKAFS